MVRVQACPGVFMIVVQGQQPASRIGELEHRIHRGVEATGGHFRDDRIAGTALDPEHVPVARPIHASVDDDGKLHLLCVRRVIVGLLVEAFRQRIQSERHVVGNESLLVRGDQVDSRFRGLGRQDQLGLLEIPAVHLDRHRIAHPGA